METTGDWFPSRGRMGCPCPWGCSCRPEGPLRRCEAEESQGGHSREEIMAKYQKHLWELDWAIWISHEFPVTRSI